MKNETLLTQSSQNYIDTIVKSDMKSGDIPGASILIIKDNNPKMFRNDHSNEYGNYHYDSDNKWFLFHDSNPLIFNNVSLLIYNKLHTINNDTLLNIRGLES
jgi:hypothetical protein